MASDAPVARGRHAPPPEVRLPLQRERLLQAAAEEFASVGYAGASAESISRRAGMSKATFYEHFSNKEDCIVALLYRAWEVIGGSIVEAARKAGGDARESENGRGSNGSSHGSGSCRDDRGQYGMRGTTVATFPIREPSHFVPQSPQPTMLSTDCERP